VLVIPNDLLINYEIKDKELRVLDSDGSQLGIMSNSQAIALAESKDLDLCMISPKANPPVCKIMDYGKYRFEMSKREKEAKKKQKVITLKEIQLSPNIEEHDMRVKAKKAFEFLENGDKIKVTIRFRGRQMAHTEIGLEVMNHFYEIVQEKANIERPAVLEGRNMLMILVSK
jgi:translation initiation factor IF-3